MAITQSGDPISSALGAFGSSSLKRDFLSGALNDYIKKLVAQQSGNLGTYSGLWDKFRSGLDTAGQQISDLKPVIQSKLGSLFQSFVDPFTTSSQLQARDLGAVNDITGRVGDYATRGTKLANAMLGGGRPLGSAAQSFITGDVSRATLPLYQTVLAQNPSASAQIEADRRAQLASKLGILGQQLNLPMVGTDIPLTEAGALRDITGGQIAQANDTATAFRNNLLGTHMQADTITKIANSGNNFMNSIWGAAGNLMSIYSGLMSGGMAGGAGAGAPTNTTAPVGNAATFQSYQGFPQMNQSPYMPVNNAPAYSVVPYAYPSAAPQYSPAAFAQQQPAGGINWSGF